jgi:FPC/CPF motif-containing protein YcgG
MTGQPPGRLIRSSQVETTRGWPAWFTAAHAEFRAVLLAEPPHPCHFGVAGERADHNWFTALDESQQGLGLGIDELAETLAGFATVALTGPSKQSLVVLAGPPRKQPEWEQHSAQFWAILRQLSRHDRQPWPVDRPVDPQSPRWQWCFAGQAWFVFGASPAYRHRRSRNLGSCLTLVFQLSDRVFEGLSGSSPAGQAAKRQIRHRLADYDLATVHRHLGDAGQSSSHKWRQYFLPDDSRTFDERSCPWTAPSNWPVTTLEPVPGRKPR